MTFSITPAIGVDLNNKGKATGEQALGVKVHGSDGYTYLRAKAGGTIAAGASCAVDSSFNATSGAGNYVVPAGLTGGVAAGDIFWAQASAL